MILVIAFISIPFGTGDTAELVLSSQRMRECLSSGILVGCSGMDRFGLSPHLISMILLSIFNDINSTINAWSLLNFFLFIYLIYLLHKKYGDSRNFLLGSIVFSPLPAYAVYSYTEMSFILFSFVLLLNLKNERYLLASFLGIFLSAYKESAILLILPLSLAVILSNRKKLINQDYILMFSQAFGFVSIYLFNYFKSSEFGNPRYTSGQVTEFKMQLSSFFGIWFSPSGGIVGYFWISIVILLGYNLYCLNKYRDHKKSLYLIIFAIIINALLLANWYSPFGWATWGPRLFMPCVVLALFSAIIVRGRTEVIQSRIANYSHLIFSYLASISLIGFLINSDSYPNWINNVILKSEACPKLPNWETDRQDYIPCVINMTWNPNSLSILTIKNYLKFLFEMINSFNIFTFPILIFTFSFLAYFFKSIKNYDNKD
jgi:hypothetical protein